ncbi:hypothetical protein NQ318_010770 [Aromia moschata]|uniref:PHD-type domain-containing protein n=1 Tax=Aromia moschata TaxID=1265417 RepID=A0AAV8YWJ6_9CUCU|nr:hypothetical protein NQ318_010770 [Aromia moschata]
MSVMYSLNTSILCQSNAHFHNINVSAEHIQGHLYIKRGEITNGWKCHLKKSNRQFMQVKNKLQKRRFYQYTEDQLQRALFEIREKNMSINKASKEFNVPKTSIIDRMKGRSRPNRHTVEKIAKDLGKSHLFTDGKPGQKWYINFMKRHPEISKREAEGVNRARAVITEEYLRAWFRDLHEYLETNNIADVMSDPSRVFNGDESGFSLCPKSGKVLAPKGWKNLYTIKLGQEKDNITVLVTFSANGKIAPPLVAFPYIRPPRALVENMPDHWVLGKSDSGWMTGTVFFEYIANDFNKWLDENDIRRPVILFLDGHRSHMTLPLSEFCQNNGIILYALPPNSTHIIQPADVSVFKPLKTEWKKTIRKWQKLPENINSCVTKMNFCKVFQSTLDNCDMGSHIVNGFRKCGLYPLCADNLDYTKCVQNILERQNAGTQDGAENPISIEEFKATKKVISKMRIRLTNKGINVDEILNEIRDYENQGTTIEVGSVVQLNDVTIIPFENVYIQNKEQAFLELVPSDEPSSLQENVSSESNSINDNQHEINLESISNSTVHDCLQENVASASNSMNNKRPEGNLESISNSTIDACLEENVTQSNSNNDNRHEIKLGPISNPSIHDCLEENVASASNSMNDKRPEGNLESISNSTIHDCLEENLSSESNSINDNRHKINIESIYFLTNNLPVSSNTSPISPLVQKINDDKEFVAQNCVQTSRLHKNAISCDLVQSTIPSTENDSDLNKSLENFPANIDINVQPFTKESHETSSTFQSRTKNYQKKKEKTKKSVKKRKGKGSDSQLLSPTNKENIKCSSCNDELISDTEDDSEKNIGCDECPRWFHMKCTAFCGLPYSEAANKDYICLMCSENTS